MASLISLLILVITLALIIAKKAIYEIRSFLLDLQLIVLADLVWHLVELFLVSILIVLISLILMKSISIFTLLTL